MLPVPKGGPGGDLAREVNVSKGRSQWGIEPPDEGLVADNSQDSAPIIGPQEKDANINPMECQE